MNTTPNTAEEYAAKIPALTTLMSLGWEYLPPTQCISVRGGNKSVIIKSVLVDELKKRRFDYKGQSYPLSPNAIDQIVRDLSAPTTQEGLLTANEKFYNAMALGVTVTEFVDGHKYEPTIRIIDWENPENNRFQVTEEFEVLTTDGTSTVRPDIVCLVNGLPLVVIEAKRPDSGNPNTSMVDEGISQNIRNQKQDYIPHLFSYAQLLLSISSIEGRYGTTKTNKEFWAKWTEKEFTETEFQQIKNKKLSADQSEILLAGRADGVKNHFRQLWLKDQLTTDQDRLLISLLTKDRLLEFIRFFLIFDKKVGKIAARYQQAFGIKNLLKQITKKKPQGGREGGVIWHTTGSGKSFTMVYLCKALLLHKELAECRIVVVTDRIDLEKQLARTFLSGGALGTSANLKSDEENKYKASSGKDLIQRINDGSERIVFTIIDKIGKAAKLGEFYNPSENIIVLIDEGHRSHAGETHERMKKALPNAAYIAFTGTPLLKKDITTNKFGPIIDSYTMQQAVEDGTVTPLLYEERKPLLDINERAIDNWFDTITSDLTDKQQSDLKDKYSNKGQIYGSENRIDLIAWDIANHFDLNFKSLGLDLKGQLATDSKLAAIRYKKALDKTGKVTSAVIISQPDTREGHKDVDEAELPEVQQWWSENIKDNFEDYERQTIEAFSESGAPDILIVVDKLLTGFDEPKNAVLYIDKPLKQHNLIQAIARVNRLHEKKKYGLLIDYRGILKELDIAISDYRDLAEKTQGGFDIEQLQGLYSEISTEYKRLPSLHETLLSIFHAVKNRLDLEQYRQLLIPKMEQGENNELIDVNQKVREDFYEALSNFGICLKVALGSPTFYDDASISESQIAAYKKDLKFFINLRKMARQDAQETVDFGVYEDQIRRLVDRHVIGEKVKDAKGVYLVNELGQNDDPKGWSEEKLRNETDLIRTRVTKTIDQDLADDPYAQMYFSQLLKDAIKAVEALFDHPFEQYAMFEDLEKKTNLRDVEGIPVELANNKHAAAYFGILQMLNETNTGSAKKLNRYIDISLEMDQLIKNAVAEYSLNPQSIEAEIRKGLLPILFKEFGLEQAKEVTESIINVTRVGLSRGDF